MNKFRCSMCFTFCDGVPTRKVCDECNGSKILYLLVDLERSIRYCKIHYWKENSRGYTTNVEEAGRYSLDEAAYLIDSDLDKRTVPVPVELEVVKRILQ